MLTVARALMGNPKVLLLDEPSLGLAPKIVEELYEVFSELRDGVLAMVLVEQYVTYALDLCDHALVLENGEVVARGSGAELQATNALSEAYLG
jgi:branched-chain amino acid transport system ATP-binding protein